jgi:hypothetical protein
VATFPLFLSVKTVSSLPSFHLVQKLQHTLRPLADRIMQTIAAELNNLFGQVTSHAFAENSLINKANAIHANITKIS